MSIVMSILGFASVIASNKIEACANTVMFQLAFVVGWICNAFFLIELFFLVSAADQGIDRLAEQKEVRRHEDPPTNIFWVV